METVNSVRRLVLTLDCYVGHEFSMRHAHITNMQRYVIQKKKLEEMEAIRIFYAVAKIVERLHEARPSMSINNNMCKSNGFFAP